MSLVLGVRWSFRGKDAGRPHALQHGVDRGRCLGASSAARGLSRAFRQALLVAFAAVVFAAQAAAAPPRAGVVAPGKSLGGLELGATRAQVRAAWGPRFGSCRGCREPTWYFNFRKFAPQGAGVAFRSNRSVALFTLWAPPGWRTDRGLRIGDDGARVAALHGPLLRVGCGTYDAFTMRGRSAVTAVYVHDGRVWGFGLSRPGVPVCR